MEIRISENIRRFRKEKNFTQETLANMLSITPQSVSKWERGEGFPDITMLPAIANCLGVSVDVLLGERSDHRGRTHPELHIRIQAAYLRRQYLEYRFHSRKECI